MAAPISLELNAVPNNGPAPLLVHFDLQSEYIFDDYRWDFDGDGIIDVNTSIPHVDYTYTNIGTYRPTVRVDYQGIDIGKSVIVDVGGGLKVHYDDGIDPYRFERMYLLSTSEPFLLDKSVETDENGDVDITPPSVLGYTYIEYNVDPDLGDERHYVFRYFRDSGEKRWVRSKDSTMQSRIHISEDNLESLRVFGSNGIDYDNSVNGADINLTVTNRTDRLYRDKNGTKAFYLLKIVTQNSAEQRSIRPRTLVIANNVASHYCLFDDIELNDGITNIDATGCPALKKFKISGNDSLSLEEVVFTLQKNDMNITVDANELDDYVPVSELFENIKFVFSTHDENGHRAGYVTYTANHDQLIQWLQNLEDGDIVVLQLETDTKIVEIGIDADSVKIGNGLLTTLLTINEQNSSVKIVWGKNDESPVTLSINREYDEEEREWDYTVPFDALPDSILPDQWDLNVTLFEATVDSVEGMVDITTQSSGAQDCSLAFEFWPDSLKGSTNLIGLRLDHMPATITEMTFDRIDENKLWIDDFDGYIYSSGEIECCDGFGKCVSVEKSFQ
ncbi:PKD domain-containing protein [Hydrogenimonas sp. SS33]|uniref:PKD domain-containing protein n=1 Tax=Hydrogenimonas leucolamina TaxID=2954236 RepID=UPI00336C13D4